MWLSLFLLVLCANWSAQSQSESASYTEQRDTKAVFTSLGYCSEENCGGYELSDSTDETHPVPQDEVTSQNPEGDENEPHNPQVVACIRALEAGNLEFISIEAVNVISVLLKKLIDITLYISSSDDEACFAQVLDVTRTVAFRLRMDYMKSAAEYSCSESNVLPEHPNGAENEPQNDEPDHSSYDRAFLEVCDHLSEAESKTNFVKPLTNKVLRQLVYQTFALYLSNMSNSENCDPVIHLLDTIEFAAVKLKMDYAEYKEEQCIYDPGPGYESLVDSIEYPVPQHASPKVNGIPEVTTSEYRTSKPSTEKPCTDKHSRDCKPSTEKPCTDKPPVDCEAEIISEDDECYSYPPFVGSVRGIPGEHYPNYAEIPITSFSCADKKYIPGFYADLETGCQVFHVCYEHRRESFLCPLGTIFNQPILACDFWYSSNCSLAPIYYKVNAKTVEVMKPEKIDSAVDELITTIIESKSKVPEKENYHKDPKFTKHALEDLVKFLPVKAKVTALKDVHSVGETKIVLPEKPEEKFVDDVASVIFDNILTTATRVVSKTRDAIGKLPDPSEIKMKNPLPILKPIKSPAVPVWKMKAVPVVKAKMAKAAIPVVAKVVAAKATVPIAAKSKLAAKAKLAAIAVPSVKVLAAKSVAIPAKVLVTKGAVPMLAKGKVAAVLPVAAKTKLVGVPKSVMKATVPVLKTKILASSLPFAKSSAAAIPVAKAKIVAPALKTKVMKTASIPLIKGKLALPLVKAKVLVPVPVAKAKLAKSVAISPLTKKALALGYMKLLKAKKFTLMG